jgi:very-short-patch-repair endonuclease
VLNVQFEEQKVIPEGRTIADFYIPEQRLVIYADGDYWHSLPNVKKRDETQNFLLEFHGYKVLRLWEKAIKNNEFKKCITSSIRKGGENG